MSAIAGCQAFGSSAPDPEVLARLTQSLTPRGPDGVSQAAAPGVAMIHAALHIAPPPHPEPFLRRGALLLTWDGRLDNRDDLEEALGAERGASDLELLAGAYERWGLEFPTRITGDFALALWDERERRLLLSRDPAGTRPLFHAYRPGGLVWASTLRALRAAGTALGGIEEEWIAGYFSRSIDPALTPWRNVRAVPPGCTVVACNGELRTTCWWRVDAIPPLPLGSDADYEERFRELFLAAVRRRLRAAAPVTAELSGGLDSSSIVCAADHLLRRGAAEAPDLLTVSHVYERSPSGDERPFMKEVETRIGRIGRQRRHVLESEAPSLAGLTAGALDVPTPSACFRELHRATFGFMAENGSRVLLSGLGGDHLLISEVPTPYPLADRLQARNLRGFLPALRYWQAELDKPYLLILWEGALCPLLPRPLRLRLNPRLMPLPPWLDRGFVRRRDLTGRFIAAADVEGDFPSPGKRLHAGAVRSVLRAVSWMYDRWDAPVQVAYPFLDRDLVEFCLGLPIDQLVRPPETRSLLRRSLAGLLPPRIARRQDKQGPDEAILRAFGEQWSEIKDLADAPRAAELGWFDPVAFRQTLQEARFGKAGNHLPSLLPSLALEAWLRTSAL